MPRVEFYISGQERGLIVALDAEAVPRKGEFVSISGNTWRILRVTWAVDHSDDPRHKQLRAVVEMEQR